MPKESVVKRPVLVGPDPVLVAWPGYPTVLVQPGEPAPDWIPVEALSASWGDRAVVPSPVPVNTEE